jgi:ABC-type uncharacterized transport system substrate-binding protein
MEVFRELLPSLSRIVVLYNPENVSKPPEAAQAVAFAREQGLGARSIEFRTAEDIYPRKKGSVVRSDSAT